MLRALLTAALALAALMAGTFPNDASAGGWRGQPYRTAARFFILVGATTAFPGGYVIPTAPYAYPVVYDCLRRYPVPRPWGVGWREAWAC
jgi:hypothetical protein